MMQLPVSLNFMAPCISLAESIELTHSPREMEDRSFEGDADRPEDLMADIRRLSCRTGRRGAPETPAPSTVEPPAP